MKEPMNTRQKMYHYLPDAQGNLVRKNRNDMTAMEHAFIVATKDLEGRNPEELQRYQDAAKQLHE
jgi:hypothetical protein